MAWVTIPNTDIDTGSSVTVSLMTALRDNIEAAMNGDAGAPNVQTAAYAAASVDNAAMASAAIKQGNLSTTTGIISATATTAGRKIYPGGQYTFLYGLRVSNTTYQYAAYQVGGSGLTTELATDVGLTTSDTYGIYLDSNHGTLATIYCTSRYVQASPPYNLGNGDIPLFIFAQVNKATGKIEGVYIAQDPPWANNGKTNTRPDFYDKAGKGFQNKLRLPHSAAVALSNPTKQAENIAALLKPKYDRIEVTQKIKQADMPDIPHPFPDNNNTHVVVLLDPLSDLCHAAREMNANGDNKQITDILEGDYLTIGRKKLAGMVTPPGVVGVSVNFK